MERLRITLVSPTTPMVVFMTGKKKLMELFGSHTMKIDGKCLCGNITYEAEVDPNQVYICNCTDCQTLAGSAFRWSVTIAEADFKLITGEPKIFIKTLDSGATGSHQVFCPDCGSPLYSTTPPGDETRFFNVRVATARQHTELPPKLQYWKSSAPKWLTEVGQIKDEGGVTL